MPKMAKYPHISNIRFVWHIYFITKSLKCKYFLDNFNIKIIFSITKTIVKIALVCYNIICIKIIAREVAELGR